MSDPTHNGSLPRTPANYAALSPLDFLERAAFVYPQRLSVVHGQRRYTWAQTFERVRRLAGSLQALGVGKHDTVAVMLANTPEMYEAHFAVPLAGGILNTLNIRLDADTLAYIFEHGEAKVLITDTEFSEVIKDALGRVERDIKVIDVADPEADSPGERLGSDDYEALIQRGDPEFTFRLPEDEWESISLNYTSGTTGRPKGVVYSHRGAYLLAMGNILAWDMTSNPTYLWTLPMFHCNGWCFPWTMAAVAGTSVCLRKVDGNAVLDAIEHQGVTHFCGAPIVLSTVAEALAASGRSLPHPVNVMTAAAPPPAKTLETMQSAGFDVTHVYGLTEVYGPAVVCDWQEEWNDLPIEQQAQRKARQGVRYHVLSDLKVMDPETMTEVPWDGKTIGEIMLRGNVVMKGYLKNPEATEKAFAGGYFHSGDLAVVQADGYIQIQDRSKDIIISGGENISSVEVEGVLYRHPGVAAAAVVAKPDDKWGETPCAFIELREGHGQVSAEEIIAFCRDYLAGFKCPKHVVFRELPKTSTGKIQKFQLREMAKEV